MARALGEFVGFAKDFQDFGMTGVGASNWKCDGICAGVVFEIPRRLDLQRGEFRLHASKEVARLIRAPSCAGNIDISAILARPHRQPRAAALLERNIALGGEVDGARANFSLQRRCMSRANFVNSSRSESHEASSRAATPSSLLSGSSAGRSTMSSGWLTITGKIVARGGSELSTKVRISTAISGTYCDRVSITVL
jgi:hypothetical protein